MSKLMAQVDELNENFNELGEDIVMLEALVIASHTGYEFPEEYIGSGLKRIGDYIHQHLGEIQHISQIVYNQAIPPQAAASRPRTPGSLL